MIFEELKQILQEAINKLFKNDKYLFQKNVSERAISHKLACYISEIAPKIGKNIGWHIDAEYNRNVEAPKTLRLDGIEKCVVPDILIHRRGLNNDGAIRDNNLLVIEIKKNAKTIGKEKDIEKIKLFINDDPYRYKYGLFINFKTRTITTTYQLNWFCGDCINLNCEELENGSI